MIKYVYFLIFQAKIVKICDESTMAICMAGVIISMQTMIYEPNKKKCRFKNLLPRIDQLLKREEYV